MLFLHFQLTQICGEKDPGFTRTLVGSKAMTLPPQAIWLENHTPAGLHQAKAALCQACYTLYRKCYI